MSLSCPLVRLSVEAAAADFMVVYAAFWIPYFQVLVFGALLKRPFLWFHTLKSVRGSLLIPKRMKYDGIYGA